MFVSGSPKLWQNLIVRLSPVDSSVVPASSVPAWSYSWSWGCCGLTSADSTVSTEAGAGALGSLGPCSTCCSRPKSYRKRKLRYKSWKAVSPPRRFKIQRCLRCLMNTFFSMIFSVSQFISMSCQRDLSCALQKGNCHNWSCEESCLAPLRQLLLDVRLRLWRMLWVCSLPGHKLYDIIVSWQKIPPLHVKSSIQPRIYQWSFAFAASTRASILSFLFASKRNMFP